jgi:hypothetical protein
MNEIALDKDVYDELLAVTVWCDAAPNTPNFVEVAGDRFFNNVREFQLNCIPDDAFDFDKYYIINFEVDGDELYVLLGNDETGEELETPVKVVPKG